MTRELILSSFIHLNGGIMTKQYNKHERKLKSKIGKEVSKILGHFKKWPELYMVMRDNILLVDSSIYSIAYGAKKIINISFKSQKALSCFERHVFDNDFNKYFKNYLFSRMANNTTSYDDGYDFFYYPNSDAGDMVIFNLRDTCDGLKALSKEVETYRRCYFDLGLRELYIDRPDLFFNEQYTHINNSPLSFDWDSFEVFTGFKSVYVP